MPHELQRPHSQRSQSSRPGSSKPNRDGAGPCKSTSKNPKPKKAPAVKQVRHAATSQEVAEKHSAAAIQAAFRGRKTRTMLQAEGVVPQTRNIEMIRAIFSGTRQKYLQQKKQQLKMTLRDVSNLVKEETHLYQARRQVVKLIVETSETAALQRKYRAQVVESLACDDLALLEDYLLNILDDIDKRVEVEDDFEDDILAEILRLRKEIRLAKDQTASVNEYRATVVRLQNLIQERVDRYEMDGLHDLQDQVYQSLKAAQSKTLELHTTLISCGFAGLESLKDEDLDFKAPDSVTDVESLRKLQEALKVKTDQTEPEGDVSESMPQEEGKDHNGSTWKRMSMRSIVDSLVRWRPHNFNTLVTEVDALLEGTHPIIVAAATIQASFRGAKERKALLNECKVTAYLRKLVLAAKNQKDKEIESGTNDDLVTDLEKDSGEPAQTHMNFQLGESVEVVTGGTGTDLEWATETVKGDEQQNVSRGINAPPQTPSTASGGQSRANTVDTSRDGGFAWGNLFEELPHEDPPYQWGGPDTPFGDGPGSGSSGKAEARKRPSRMSKLQSTSEGEDEVPLGQDEDKSPSCSSSTSSKNDGSTSSDATESEASETESEDNRPINRVSMAPRPLMPMCGLCPAKDVTFPLECELCYLRGDRVGRQTMRQTRQTARQTAVTKFENAWATEFEDLTLPPPPPVCRFGLSQHPKFTHLNWHEYSQVDLWAQQKAKESLMANRCALNNKTLEEQREDLALSTVIASCKKEAEHKKEFEIEFVHQYLEPLFRNFFHLVPQRIQKEVCQKFTSIRFHAGDTLWAPGDVPDGIYFVLRGQINSFDGDKTSAVPNKTMGPGSIGGAEDIFSGGYLGAGNKFQFYEGGPLSRNSTAVVDRQTDVLKLCLETLDAISQCRLEIEEEELCDAMYQFFVPVQKNRQLIPKLVPCMRLQDIGRRRIFTHENAKPPIESALIVVVVSGELQLKKNGKMVGTVGLGGVVGEEALYGKKYRFTTVCASEAKGLILTAKDYLEQIEKRSCVMEGGAMFNDDDQDATSGPNKSRLVPAKVLNEMCAKAKRQSDAKHIGNEEWKKVGMKGNLRPPNKTPISSCLPFVTPSPSGIHTGVPTEIDLFPLSHRAHLMKNSRARGQPNVTPGATGKVLLGAGPPTASKLELRLSKGVLDPMASKASLATLTTTASHSQGSFSFAKASQTSHAAHAARQRLLNSFSNDILDNGEHTQAGSMGLRHRFQDIESPTQWSQSGPATGHTLLLSWGSIVPSRSKPPASALRLS